MDVVIHKSSRLDGTVTVPGSKSYTHRAVAVASLCAGRTVIENPSNSDACAAMIRACRQLGASVVWTDDKSLEVVGTAGRPRVQGGLGEIDMGNSGTAMRIVLSMAGLAAMGGGDGGDGGTPITITGDASLRGRPVKPLLDALRALGVDAAGAVRGGDEYVPVTVGGASGGMGRGGGDGVHNIGVSCAKSSQHLSSLMIGCSFAGRGVEIAVTDSLVSRPYVGITLDVLRAFGLPVEGSEDMMRYRVGGGDGMTTVMGPGRYRVPGDYSQAAFFLAAGCLVDSDIRVAGLDPDDSQGDKVVVDILRRMGAAIVWDDGGDGGGCLRVTGPCKLRGVDVDLVDAPDLFPVLAVVGAHASGKTRLYNMPQIRSKETDRIAVMERELGGCGVRTESGDDEMTVYGGIGLRGGFAPGARDGKKGGGDGKPDPAYALSAAGRGGVTDHRVAMALSLVGLRNGPVLLKNADGIAVSYPDYLHHMERVGMRTHG